MLEKFFNLKANKTTVRTEVIAGITTFMTMAYILAVNPDILSATGMDKSAVFTATTLSAIVGTLVMALWARLPFALAPGMGLNAFFAFTVVLGMGYSWQFALTAVLLEGIIFLILTAFNIREVIVNAIPMNMKHAISAGIGLFIAFIGMQNTGLIVNSDATLVTLGDMSSHTVWITLFGLVVIGVLLALKVRGALLIGIFAATIAGIPLGVTHLPEGSWLTLPPSIEPIAFKFDFSNIFSVDMLIVLFTFLFVDMFDTVGTLIGVASKADMIREDGTLPRAKQALFADAVGTTVGAMLGTSTVTTYVESASGVAEGGRTGLTALTTTGMFFLALFLSPLFLMVPAAATAPALILVGSFMMSPILKINFDDYTESIPVFLTIIMMPLAYSIAEGIVFGMLSYVALKLLSGRGKEISWIMILLSILFVLKFFF
ncbi:NCS2 family permease [Thermophagus xiamenensis]|uniref:Putative MFS transporter, AGZA family, xanthine/uracil permease n=1 Tax=Thermophagus xiamenensis TaxID=385682 RepID=A0A1I2DPQ8_9BACT|nr:NCS2 family permease [Thermophagus xiamenensis]SFE82321.1 putative MFS transporter, AGZA family, xanthine/uracil permease [Thermophagus xiamenensis]